MMLGPLSHTTTTDRQTATNRIRAKASFRPTFALASNQSISAVNKIATTMEANKSKTMTLPSQASRIATITPTARNKTIVGEQRSGAITGDMFDLLKFVHYKQTQVALLC